MLRRSHALGSGQNARQAGGIVNQDGKMLGTDPKVRPLIAKGDERNLLRASRAYEAPRDGGGGFGHSRVLPMVVSGRHDGGAPEGSAIADGSGGADP
jgi:hypothetical protein